jgi:hypothetical protein
MAAILSITYTPNYVGCHRICFRTSEENYCCYLDESGVVVGTPKTVIINLTEDYSDCIVTTPIEFGCQGELTVEGYIQACCVDANSLTGRIPFDAEYNSTPCESYSITCPESGIGSVLVVDGGYGWPVGFTPTVNLINTGVLGSGFLAHATMTCLPGENFCSINDIIVDDPGENYFDLNDLSIDISPLPSCISNDLIVNGDFTTNLNDWIITPVPNVFYWDSGAVRYNNTVYGATTPGFIGQNILTPGNTYEVTINTVSLLANTGYCQIIISAGTFDISGTQPNQFSILRLPTDPLYTTPITVTLTCTGSTSFNIYAYTTAIDAGSIIRLSDISVVEQCVSENPIIDIVSLDGCPTFVVPNCDGSANPATYALRGGSASVSTINVCSGGAGPVGAKYTITKNAIALPGNICFNLGIEAFGPYTCSISPAGTYNGKNYYIMVAPDCVTPYSSQIAPQVWTVWYSTGNGYVNQWVLSEALNQYLYVQNYLPVSSSPNFPLGNWVIGPESGAIDISSTDTNCQVSCCDCRLYQIVVRNPIDMYYTSCNNQAIDVISVESGIIGVTVCAAENSVWPVNKDDNAEILSITDVGSCTENP